MRRRYMVLHTLWLGHNGNVEFARSLTEATTDENAHTPGIAMASIFLVRLHATVLLTAHGHDLDFKKL
ncbi:hypothetical protein VPNG_03113 [Cytospora leucostoma]|uniref:Uncharacterized protein n=1 Tax=Cytospora leucostoma TaxID=1230097 RepID=A0A423XEH8_9PEZI|nr:hypothetical protein VPNG_03113 [Cytospora leucostoma]